MTMLSFILWVLIGVATGYLAGQRGRDPVIWFMIGILLGVFGLLLLFIMPAVGQDLKANDTEGDDITLPVLPPTAHPHDSYLIKDWFYLDSFHQQQGPVRYPELKQAWQAGKINGHSFVWCEGMVEWQKVDQLPDLNKALEVVQHL